MGMGHEFLYAADHIAEPSFQTDLVLRNANLSRSALHGLFWIDNDFFLLFSEIRQILLKCCCNHECPSV